MNTELEEQLRGAMERFAGDVRVPPGLAVKAYRHQQKRRITTRAVAAAGTAAAVAAAVAIAGAAGAFGSAASPPVQTAYTAYVVRHVEHALAAPRLGHLVEADRTVFPPGATLQPFPHALVGTAAWCRDQLTVGSRLHTSLDLPRAASRCRRSRPADSTSLTGASARPTGPRRSSTHRGTWWTAAAGSGPGGTGPAPSGCVKGLDIALNGGAGNGWPAVIRAQLACGAYKVADRQVIDGINTIKITGGGGRFTFWVNPAMYLPVRARLGQRQTGFRWLPATPARLAQLKVTVPAGFRQVPAPAAPAGQAP